MLSEYKNRTHLLFQDLSSKVSLFWLITQGFIWIVVGALVALMLFSFSQSDPSFNAAFDSTINNYLGFIGSYLSDLLFQIFGKASFLCPLFFFSLGAKKVFNKEHPRFFSLAFLASIILTSCALAFNNVADYSKNDGGAIGYLLSTPLIEISNSSFGLSVGSWILSFFSLNYALGGTFVFWKSLFAKIFSLSTHTSKILSQTKSFSAAKESIEEEEKTTDEETPSHLSLRIEPRSDFNTTKSTPKLSKTIGKASLQKSSAEKEKQQTLFALDLGEDSHQLPPLNLLSPGKDTAKNTSDPKQLSANAQLLMTVLEDFGIRGEIIDVSPGPVVTLYEFKPAAGIKASRIIGLADDIARSMSALSARVSPIPGRNVLGIELPNKNRETVFLRQILSNESYERFGGNLPLILGKNIGGSPIVTDLSKMPHLLVAGTTGSGKSVAINTMILSLLYRLPPERCRFIMIDPKMLELSVYEGIPHLLTSVVTDPKKAIVALKWTVKEMENRYRDMSKLGVRNIEGYNLRLKEAREKQETISRKVQTGFDSETGKPIFENQSLNLEPLPFIVVVVDEMADLMMVAGKEIEAAVQRLAQMARAAGIHLIMATQRPSVDVITGTIKANFPTRISFQVTSKIDSRTILGDSGAEQLLGQGDMLYMASGGRLTRVHGPFVSDTEVEKVVQFLKDQGEPSYVDDITLDDENENGEENESSKSFSDPLYQQAIELVMREGKASTSFIQRHLQIGYNRAARIMDKMEADNIVGAANHVGKREILGR